MRGREGGGHYVFYWTFAPCDSLSQLLTSHPVCRTQEQQRFMHLRTAITRSFHTSSATHRSMVLCLFVCLSVCFYISIPLLSFSIIHSFFLDSLIICNTYLTIQKTIFKLSLVPLHKLYISQTYTIAKRQTKLVLHRQGTCQLTEFFQILFQMLSR